MWAARTNTATFGPARTISMPAGLKRNGIAREFEEYEGTHTSRIGERLETRTLPFFSRVLAFSNRDAPPKAKKQEQR